MGDKTGISWADATWNPVTGCTKVSPGCAHCYAERIIERFGHRPGMTYADDQQEDAGHELDFSMVTLHRNRLDIPIRWRQPRRIFVCSMGDLFHEDVPEAFIRQVFQMMALAVHHVFQILTKRPARMLDVVQRLPLETENPEEDTLALLRHTGYWPLPNVWLGVSAEDQQRADERIPLLLQTPAAMRFASLEPLLGPVDLSRYGWLSGCDACCTGDRCPGPPECLRFDRRTCPVCHGTAQGHNLDWVIVGGESGPKARPMHPDWARSVRDQCQAAQVPFHFKGWGGPKPTSGGRLLDGREWNEFPEGR